MNQTQLSFSLYSIGPLFIFDAFGTSEGTIGIMFSIGAFSGSVFTFIAFSSRYDLDQVKCRAKILCFVLSNVLCSHLTSWINYLRIKGTQVPKQACQISVQYLHHFGYSNIIRRWANDSKLSYSGRMRHIQPHLTVAISCIGSQSPGGYNTIELLFHARTSLPIC